MPKIKYIEKKLSSRRLDTVEAANEIIEEYQQEGFDLTVRQLYYQFVVREIIENKQSEYNRLADLINDGRLVGLIDWNAIEDRSRFVREQPSWNVPEEILDAASQQFRLDKWAEQEVRIEAWIEKDALVSVIEAPCLQFSVPFFSCRGYVSQSEMWRAAQRFRAFEEQGQKVILLHLGDHDPSGIDMTRDIQERLETFGSEVTVLRKGLTWEQIELYDPPPNPAKITDSRFKSYSDKYGLESWELDALEPSVLAELVKSSIESFVSILQWEDVVQRETVEKNRLKKVQENWTEVTKFLEDKDGKN